MTTQEVQSNTSVGKGKRKTKGVKVDLHTFLNDQTEAPSGFAVAKPLNWADDEDDEDDEKYYDNKSTTSKVLILPTVPKASRTPDFDLSKVPDRPPYKAYLGNLPYDISEDEIMRFFKNLSIKDVTLIRDGDRGRIKGVGFAEFEDKESLIEALKLNGDSLKNRNIRVSLSEDNDRPSRGGFGRDRNDDREDRTAGDWRSGARERDQPLLSRNGSDYQQPYESQSYRGRFSYDKNERRGDGGFERGSFQRGDRDYRDNRDFRDGRDYRDSRDSRDFRDARDNRDNRDYRDSRDFRDNRDQDFRRGGGGGGYRDREDRYGGYDNRRDRYRDNRYSDNRDSRDYRDRSDRSDKNSEVGDRPSSRRYDSAFEPRGSRQSPSALSTDSKSNDDIPKERPKLKLQPRSKPLESDSQVSNSAIFGGAKPVDTAAREREIEEKLAKGEPKLESKEEGKGETKANNEDEAKGESKGEPEDEPKGGESKGETKGGEAKDDSKSNNSSK